MHERTSQKSWNRGAPILNKDGKPVRIFCMVPTMWPLNKKYLTQVMNSWGSRCDRIRFFVSAKDKIPDSGTFEYKGMSVPFTKIDMVRREDTVFAVNEKNQRPIWEKLWRTYSWLYDNELNSEDACDWYIKGDDDSFIFMNNLKRMLKDKDPNKPHYLGHTLSNHVSSGGPALNAGACYAISRKTLEIFGAKVKTFTMQYMKEYQQIQDLLPKYAAEKDKKKKKEIFEHAASINGQTMWYKTCHDQPGSNEEFTTAVCMKELGIKPGNSRDSQHRERFFVFQPKDHLTIKFLKNDWFWDGKPKEVQANFLDNCCSMDPINFHNFKDDFPKLVAMNDFEKVYEKVRRTGKAVPENKWLPDLVRTHSCPVHEQKYFKKMMKWAETAGP
jgi:hypothetical protein